MQPTANEATSSDYLKLASMFLQSVTQIQMTPGMIIPSFMENKIHIDFIHKDTKQSH